MWHDWSEMIRTIKILVWGSYEPAQRTVAIVGEAIGLELAMRPHPSSVAAVDVTLGERDGMRTDVFLVGVPDGGSSRLVTLRASDGVIFVATDERYGELYEELRHGLESLTHDSATFPIVVLVDEALSADAVAATLCIHRDRMVVGDLREGAGVIEALSCAAELVLDDARSRPRRPTLPSFPSVVLVDVGVREGQVAELIHDITGKPLAESRALVAATPAVIKTSCGPRDAFVLKARFEALGATVELRADGVPARDRGALD